MGKVKEYTKDDLTVVWKPDQCIHSENCFKGLPKVFDPQKRPWVDMDGASLKAIRDQVDKCPSGALSYASNDADDLIKEEQVVEEIPNGPPYGVWEYSGQTKKW